MPRYSTASGLVAVALALAGCAGTGGSASTGPFSLGAASDRQTWPNGDPRDPLGRPWYHEGGRDFPVGSSGGDRPNATMSPSTPGAGASPSPGANAPSGGAVSPSTPGAGAGQGR